MCLFWPQPFCHSLTHHHHQKASRWNPTQAVNYLYLHIVGEANVAEFHWQFMVRAILPPHTFLAKCCKTNRGIRNFNELRRSVWGENGRVVEWHRSVGIFVVTDDCTVSKLGAGQENQIFNCETLAADQQIFNDNTGGCLIVFDGFQINHNASNTMSPVKLAVKKKLRTAKQGFISHSHSQWKKHFNKSSSLSSAILALRF